MITRLPCRQIVAITLALLGADVCAQGFPVVSLNTWVVDAAGVARPGLECFPLSYQVRSSGDLQDPPDRLAGSPPAMVFTISISDNWDQVNFTVTGGPGGGSGLFANGPGSIVRGRSVQCFGTPYADAVCDELFAAAAAGFYTVTGQTLRNGQVVGSANQKIYVGGNSGGPPAIPPTTFIITGVGSGNGYSLGLSAGATLTDVPPMTIMPTRPAGTTPTLFAADFVAEINQVAGFGATDLGGGSLSVDASPGGQPFYIWVGDGGGSPHCVVGGGSGCQFNPRIDPAPECFLLLGVDATDVPLPWSPSDSLYVIPFVALPVSLTDIPAFAIPNDPNMMGFRLNAQIYMDNAQVFPSDPWKMSNGLDTRIGDRAGTPYGTASGMNLWLAEPAVIGGRYRIGFSIAGLP